MSEREGLSMKIPWEFRPQIHNDAEGMRVYIPLSGEEACKELGDAFIRLGFSIWQLGRERKVPVAAGGPGDTT